MLESLPPYSPETYQDLFNDFFEIQSQFLRKYVGIAKVIKPSLLDHVAIKARDYGDTMRFLYSVAPSCTRLSYVILNNRMLATAELENPLLFGTKKVTEIEIIHPKPGKEGLYVGVQHVEYRALFGSLERTARSLDELEVFYSIVSPNQNHRTIVIDVAPDLEIKVTDRALLANVSKQILEGSSLVLKGAKGTLPR